MYTVSYRYNGTSVSIQLLQIQQNQFMYSYYRYNGTGACIQLFRETIELIHIYSYYDTIEVVRVYTQLQIQWYRCMYAVITDTIELVHVYSYSLMYLQIQQNWCMYTVFYRQNGTGAYIQLFSIIFTDTIELVHIYSYSLLYLQSQQNWCNMYSYSLLYLQIQQNWCMYIVIYRQNGTGACIQLFSIVFTVTTELVHMYSYSLSYLQIQQNWSMYSYLQIQQEWYMHNQVHIYLFRHTIGAGIVKHVFMLLFTYTMQLVLV